MTSSRKCTCILCKQPTDASNIQKHFDSEQCKRKQTLNLCLCCGNKCYNKFCSLSCAAQYLNKNKVRGYTRYFHQIKLSCVRCAKTIRIQDWKRHSCQKSRKPFSVKNNPKDKYRYECTFKFSIKEFPEWFSTAKTLIERYGWYSPSNRGNNLNGCSRDHLYSISDGYKNNIDPDVISHPANCEIIPHKLNQHKHNKSTISISELYFRIALFSKQYGEKYQIRTDENGGCSSTP